MASFEESKTKGFQSQVIPKVQQSQFQQEAELLVEGNDSDGLA